MANKQAKKRTSSSAKNAEITEFEVAIGIYLLKRNNSKYYKAKLYDEQADTYKTVNAKIADFELAKAAAVKEDRKRNAYTADVADRQICNGNVVLFKRSRSRKWQCKIRRSVGKWVDYTTAKENFDDAKIVAEEMYRDIKYRQQSGKVDVSRRFADVCKVAKRQLLAEYQKSNRTQLKDKVRVIDKYLIPLLGKYNTHNITHEVLVEFDEQRTKLLGRQLSKSAVNTHNSALNYVFNLAKAHNYIVEVPSLPKNGTTTDKRRLHFTDKEYRKLCNFMWRDLQKSEKRINTDGFDQRSFDIRELLRDVILILANSGIRCGNELLSLKWKNLSIVTKNGIDSIAFNLVKTKTNKQRTAIAYEPEQSAKEKRYGCWSCFERIRDRFDYTKGLEWNELFKKDIYIFRLKTSGKLVRTEALTKNFKTLLNRCDLLKDEFGNDRVLYSLRHTYASRRRFEGMSFDDLSIQMGTSVELLERVYSHFVVSDNPNLFSGHTKRERQKEEADAKQSMSDLLAMVKELKEQNAQLLKGQKEKR